MGALEGGIRVPGVIRWPGIVQPDSVFHHPTSLIDWLPTVSQIAGVEPMAGVQVHALRRFVFKFPVRARGIHT